MAIINSIYRPFTNKNGLTLIEVLIALTILTIGLLGVAMMQVMSISGNTFSREMVVGTELAQDMLEKLSTFEYTDSNEDNALLEGNHPDATDVGNDLAPEVFGDPDNIIDERGLWPDFAATFVPPTTAGPLIYTRTWNVVNDGLGANTNMKTIEVTVTWDDRTGTTHSVILEGVRVRE